MSSADPKFAAVIEADRALMIALSEWKDAGGHVGNVTIALHKFIGAVITHAFATPSSADTTPKESNT